MTTPPEVAETPDLLALASRVEGALGADRELDCLIAAQVGWDISHPMAPLSELLEKFGLPWLVEAATSYQSAYNCLPTYTASLDAALTLVPEGFSFEVTTTGFKPGATVCGDTLNGVHEGAYAATPALALTSAALRALAMGRG